MIRMCSVVTLVIKDFGVVMPNDFDEMDLL